MKRNYNMPQMEIRGFMREAIIASGGGTSTDTLAVQSVRSQLTGKEGELNIDVNSYIRW